MEDSVTDYENFCDRRKEKKVRKLHEDVSHSVIDADASKPSIPLSTFDAESALGYLSSYSKRTEARKLC